MLLSVKAWILRKWYRHTQLRVPELTLILKTIREYPGCRFLVFGLGHDTPLWLKMNKGGKTVFLEDHPKWFERITGEFPQATAFKIDYPHDMTQWRQLLNQPEEELHVALPEGVPLGAWDVVLVDAPQGYKESPEQKGRMSSIFMSAKLVAENGRIFVHDAERDVEKAYSDKYLRDENLLQELRGRALLKMYKRPEDGR